MMRTLKPCPFCGAIPAFAQLDTSSFSESDELYVECPNPKCGAYVCGQPSEDDAAAAWNTRAHQEQHDAGVYEAELAEAIRLAHFDAFPVACEAYHNEEKKGLQLAKGCKAYMAVVLGKLNPYLRHPQQEQQKGFYCGKHQRASFIVGAGCSECYREKVALNQEQPQQALRPDQVHQELLRPEQRAALKQEQRGNDDVRQLLTDMRCRVEYSHVATMPIPLYERIKAALNQETGGVR